jgi:hypothetical protein
MRIEVVADEVDLAGVRKVLVQQLLDLMGPVDAGAMLRRTDAGDDPPSDHLLLEQAQGPTTASFRDRRAADGHQRRIFLAGA